MLHYFEMLKIQFYLFILYLYPIEYVPLKHSMIPTALPFMALEISVCLFICHGSTNMHIDMNIKSYNSHNDLESEKLVILILT